MRILTSTLIVLLLLLAALPWLVSSCVHEPLVPYEFYDERADYNALVEAEQAREMDENRLEESTVSVIPLDEAELSEVITNTAGVTLPETLTQTVDVAAPVTESVQLTQAVVITDVMADATEITPSTVVTASAQPEPTISVTLGPENKSKVTIVGSRFITETEIVTSDGIETGVAPPPVSTSEEISTAVQADLSVLSAQSLTQTGVISEANAARIMPLGMSDVEDVITSTKLTAQLRSDMPSDLPMRNLTANITPDGFSATGDVTMVGNFTRPLVVEGTFAVENESLVVRVSSIRVDRQDFSGLYADQVEAEVKSSLYRLLPQRFVQSFELSPGEILVQSRKR